MSKQFAEFQLHDIFQIENSVRLKSGDHIPGNTPFISSRSGNNGISAWVGNVNESLDSNVLGVNYNGNVLEAYYHPYEALFSDDVKRFKIRQPGVSLRSYLYCATAIHKLKEAYSYTKKFNGDEIDVAKISLPVTDTTANTPNPEPDWEYMENYIKTIERKYIDQIAEHNSKEQAILKQLHPESINTKPEAHGFEEFKIGDIFNITPTSYHKTTSPPTSDLVPQVTNTTQPNGISSFEPYAPNNEKNVITFSDTTVGGDTLFYQPVDFLGYSHIQKMTPTETVLTRRKAMYAITAFKKSVNGKYDYGAKFNRDNATKTDIQLPVTPTGEIDWEYMEYYITWIETQERESKDTCST